MDPTRTLRVLSRILLRFFFGLFHPFSNRGIGCHHRNRLVPVTVRWFRAICAFERMPKGCRVTMTLVVVIVVGIIIIRILIIKANNN